MEILQRHIKEETINLRVTKDLKDKVIKHCNQTEQTITNTFIQAVQEVLNGETKKNI